LDDWLNVSVLERDVVLVVTGKDVFDAHTAIRHVHNVAARGHNIHVVLPPALRKHRGFTPWLVTGKTINTAVHGRFVSDSKGTVLHMNHVKTHTHDGVHFASFDMRVAGASVRCLLDTGSSCCCLSKKFLDRCGLILRPGGGSVNGIGGTATMLGHTTVSVKVCYKRQGWQIRKDNRKTKEDKTH
jgi:hypothetical protein